jgi:hypothetical protein
MYLHNVINGSLAARAVTLEDLHLAKEIHCYIVNGITCLHYTLSIRVGLECSMFCIVIHTVSCPRVLISSNCFVFDIYVVIRTCIVGSSFPLFARVIIYVFSRCIK